MSNTVQFTINLDGNAYTGIAQLDEALGGLNVQAKVTRSLIERIDRASFKINNIFQAVRNTIGTVGSAIGKVVEIGGENELQKLDMTTLFQGNSSAAEEMFEKISEYGKATVYDKSGLIEAQKTMMSFGMEGEKAFSTLKQIGDIAMGDSNKMQSLALAFSQATSAGKLQGQDLMNVMAVARTRTAKQYHDFTSDPISNELYPNIKWLPSRSASPREAHRVFWNRVWAKNDPFWNSNTPGSLWNCKCDWEETDEPVTDKNLTEQCQPKVLKEILL